MLVQSVKYAVAKLKNYFCAVSGVIQKNALLPGEVIDQVSTGKWAGVSSLHTLSS
jgi:hypothetical protein